MARSEHTKNARRVVIKIGSAVLTKDGGLDLDNLGALADQIAILAARDRDVVVVSSGAVAAGRGVLKASAPAKSTPSGLPERQAAAAVGQSRLMRAWDDAFKRRGLVSAQILLTKDDLRSTKRFLNACHTFDALFAHRVVPVVNENDVVSVDELKFGDNDSLAALILNLVEADLMLNVTSAKGVHTADPTVDPAAVCLDCIDDVEAFDVETSCGGKTSVGTGGMRSKILAARRAAQLGVPTIILSGREDNALVRALAGEAVGTFVAPLARRIPRRKFRLAYNAEPKGVLVIDAGAVRAVESGGKSLLPAGVLSVEGGFKEGALVAVKDETGRVVAAGLSNYSAGDLKRIIGKRTKDLQATLGRDDCLYPEAVHRDNLVVHAVV